MSITFSTHHEYDSIPITSHETELEVLMTELSVLNAYPILNSEERQRKVQIEARIAELEHGGTWEPMQDGKYEVRDVTGKVIGLLFILAGGTFFRTTTGIDHSIDHGIEYRLYHRTTPPADRE